MRVTFEEIGGRGSGKPFEIQELMAVIIARTLREGETVSTGAGSALARAACRLAQLTHAPNLTFVSGASGAINSYLEPLVASSGDYANLDCEAVLPVAEFVGGMAFGRMDTFMYGGMQIDRYGNANLSVIGDPAQPTLRGPGSAALPLATTAGRTILFVTEHTPRIFVPKVDFITAPGFLDGGDNWRKAKTDGLIRGNGPALVVTPLAVLDFEETSKTMRLVSVHPGVSVEDVKVATGFELLLPAELPTTEPPSPTELRTLREIDNRQLLRV